MVSESSPPSPWHQYRLGGLSFLCASNEKIVIISSSLSKRLRGCLSQNNDLPLFFFIFTVAGAEPIAGAGAETGAGTGTNAETGTAVGAEPIAGADTVIAPIDGV